ncbi:peptidyl-prolyl cis-trans isomerase 10 [Aspergillus sclerotioniger CBS 115572]|uniref:Peptidyl-prolyl cis-trans isomerase n=1 Tax=Aspergillus sclerotioniger CBS 115572 TaxID=1450535 RepID=A0A317X5C2_9EURO|nr:peptidyl-prolyl cis-trans isomerase 10 [Aspergillus sclerotioniger CBS 115572]PWY91750.1 peptidyl-prolyl cis-trans isomerase 10 [Aspergillus sclerotioniger CBS 115572]
MSVTLHTTQGDLKVELFCEAVPKTAENFIALCASGAYNNTPFHRLIPGFMIQGGDISLGPAASSTNNTKPILPFEDIPKGGTSIHHPGALNQEIHLPALKHNTRGILSMASRPVKDRTAPGAQGATGATINGSQFFVTFAAAPHLDGASTVFGKVLNLTAQDEGGDVLTRLEKANAKVDKKGRVVQPKEGEEGGEFEALMIKSVTIHANPFAK